MSSERAYREIHAALDDWVKKRSNADVCEDSSSVIRLRSQTQVLAAFEREATEDKYTRQFEGNFFYEAFHKIRVGPTVLIFHGRRESVQLVCEDEGRPREFRESCRCIVSESNGRCLWEFSAEETSIDQCRMNKQRHINIEAIIELIVTAGCPALSGSAVISFLVCLAGERVAEYFQWEMLEELDAAISTEHSRQVWFSSLRPRSHHQAGMLKRKWSETKTDVDNFDNFSNPHRQRTNMNSILGKRERDTDSLVVNKHYVLHTV